MMHHGQEKSTKRRIKDGKAAKMIVNIWKSTMQINKQEMNHLRSLNDVELTSNFLSNLKVTGQAAGKYAKK